MAGRAKALRVENVLARLTDEQRMVVESFAKRYRVKTADALRMAQHDQHARAVVGGALRRPPRRGRYR